MVKKEQKVLNKHWMVIKQILSDLAKICVQRLENSSMSLGMGFVKEVTSELGKLGGIAK